MSFISAKISTVKIEDRFQSEVQYIISGVLLPDPTVPCNNNMADKQGYLILNPSS